MGENADLVRAGFEALARDDLDAILATCHEDVEWRPLLSHAPGEDTFHGHAGIRRWWRRVQEIFPTVDNRIDEVIENGDLVYVAGRIGAQAAPGVFQTVAWVFTARDGKLARMEVFLDRADGRAAAGLDQ